MDENKTLTKLEQQILSITDGAENFEIEGKEDYDAALAIMGRFYEHKEKVDGLLRPIIEQQFKAHRTATAQYNKLVKPINEAITIFKRKMAEFIMKTQQEVKQEADEARKKLEAAGYDTSLVGVNTGMDVAKDIAKDAGMALVKEYGYEVVDVDLIPREYMTPDLKKIRTAVTSLKTQCKIPGIKITETTTLRRAGGAKDE